MRFYVCLFMYIFIMVFFLVRENTSVLLRIFSAGTKEHWATHVRHVIDAARS